MEKNKIPIWERKKDYPADLDFLVSHLLAISDRDYQLRVWCRAEGPEVDWYSERMLDFETGMDYFKSLLRNGKTSLNPSQVKAILRVYVMTLHFDNIPEELPEDWTEQQLYIINHPYWQKIQRQAEYALSLLKNNENANDKSSRTYGSINTRTADHCPKLDNRFGEKMKVFGDHRLREIQWKETDDFWNSVESFYSVFNKFFDGSGILSNGGLLNILMAFQNDLNEFCRSYEDNSVVTLKQILSDPRFSCLEQKAQDFLKLVGPPGLEPGIHRL